MISVCNRADLVERAEIIREKGTNRSQFFRGQVDKYTWVDIGSSFLPGELVAAFLYAQLEREAGFAGAEREPEPPAQRVEQIGGAGLGLAWMVVSAGDPTNGLLPMFYIPPRDLITGVVLIGVMAFIAGILPALQARRLRVADALRR